MIAWHSEQAGGLLARLSPLGQADADKAGEGRARAGKGEEPEVAGENECTSRDAPHRYMAAWLAYRGQGRGCVEQLPRSLAVDGRDAASALLLATPRLWCSRRAT